MISTTFQPKLSDNYDEDVYWIALQDNSLLIPTDKIIKYFYENKTLRDIYNLSQSQLFNLGINSNDIKKFLKYSHKLNFLEINRIYKKFSQEKIELVKYIDEKYPRLLKNIEDPPLLLFKRGKLENLQNCIAIAGTRNPTIYGRKMARKIAYDLSKKGFTIVSGLAHGIDEWAHTGALEAKNGKTVAILAWMKPEYPSEHASLLNDISKNGVILSEIYSKPNGRIVRTKFIQRNRITSGISNCVIAIESDDVGGTVRQVKIALNQNKLVFALEPKSNKRSSRGFKLFKELGAIPIKSSKDVLRTLESKMKQSTMEFDMSFQMKLVETWNKIR